MAIYILKTEKCCYYFNNKSISLLSLSPSISLLPFSLTHFVTSFVSIGHKNIPLSSKDTEPFSLEPTSQVQSKNADAGSGAGPVVIPAVMSACYKPMGSQSSKPMGFVQRLNHRDETFGREPDACLVGAHALCHPSHTHRGVWPPSPVQAVLKEVLGPWAPLQILELPRS